MNIVYRVLWIFLLAIAIVSFILLIFSIGYQINMKRRLRCFNKEIKKFNNIYDENKAIILTTEMLENTILINIKSVLEDCADTLIQDLLEQGKYILDMEEFLIEEYGEHEKTFEYHLFIQNYKNLKKAVFEKEPQKTIASKNDSV